jgi:hypothetical protein
VRSASPRSTLRAAVVAIVLGLLVFVLVQVSLAAYEVGVIRDAIDRGMEQVYPGYRVSLSTHLPSLIAGGIAYLMLAVGGSAIAGRGHRLLFALPALAYVFTPMLDGSPVRAEPIGWEWAIDCYSNGIDCSGPWFAHPWFGPMVDLGLVLAPGWIVGRLVRSRRWPGKTDAAAVAAILTSVAVVATAVWAIVVVQHFTEFRTLAAVAALGIALGVARPWWPWFHVLFAVTAAGFVDLMLDFLLWPDPGYALTDALPYALEEVWPVVAVGLIASAWQPLAWAIRKLQERPFRLVIAVTS